MCQCPQLLLLLCWLHHLSPADGLKELQAQVAVLTEAVTMLTRGRPRTPRPPALSLLNWLTPDTRMLYAACPHGFSLQLLFVY